MTEGITVPNSEIILAVNKFFCHHANPRWVPHLLPRVFNQFLTGFILEPHSFKTKRPSLAIKPFLLEIRDKQNRFMVRMEDIQMKNTTCGEVKNPLHCCISKPLHLPLWPIQTPLFLLCSNDFIKIPQTNPRDGKPGTKVPK